MKQPIKHRLLQRPCMTQTVRVSSATICKRSDKSGKNMSNKADLLPTPNLPVSVFRALLPLEGASYILHNLNNHTGQPLALIFLINSSLSAHLLEHFAKGAADTHR